VIQIFFRTTIVLALAGLVLIPVTAVSDDEEAPPEPAAVSSPSAEAYVGDETCTTCHENAHPNFDKTVHSRVLGPSGTRGGEWAQTCESCHGPGAAHVEAGGGEAGNLVTFQAESHDAIERGNAVCLGCHRMGEQLYWDGSTHEGRGLACTSCHNPVDKLSQRAQLNHANGVQVCTSCHLEQKSKIYRNNHMPLRPTGTPMDGDRGPWMDCSSCHNPHGSPTEHMLVRNSTPETCYTCHADKRGPFLWEHAPVNEDCGNCHDPHGSTRQAMLKLSLPRLCQTCHLSSLHPGEARQPGNKFVIGGSCTNCHSKIHGSNHPSGFVFTR
jgi:DmsE family decaheme c-type cytochrome